jgi:hypothetical protein
MKCAYGVVRNWDAVACQAQGRREGVAHPDELPLSLYLLLISLKSVGLIAYKLAINACAPILRYVLLSRTTHTAKMFSSVDSGQCVHTALAPASS